MPGPGEKNFSVFNCGKGTGIVFVIIFHFLFSFSDMIQGDGEQYTFIEWTFCVHSVQPKEFFLIVYGFFLEKTHLQQYIARSGT